jgi:DNA-binding transcriptional LysR family regulator
MDRLEAMRIFVAVADGAGFAPAARHLALSPPAVTRAVAALEAHIGTRLLHRTTRRVGLTEAGAHYLEDCRRILAEIVEAEASAVGAHGELAGPFTVTAPVMFGRLHVLPVLLDFLERHPRVAGRALLLDRVVDLTEEGADVAVRIAHLPDSSLSAVRVGQVRRVVVGAPAYLARRGRPNRPDDLARHDVINFLTAAESGEWTFPGPDGGPEGGTAVRPTIRLAVNAADAAIAAAIAGRGLARPLSYQVSAEVAAGRLEIVLAEHEPPPIPIHIAHREGRRASARVRAFVDYAVERLRAERSLR